MFLCFSYQEGQVGNVRLLG